MKITFLIRGEDVKEQFSRHELTDGILRTVGTYKAEGGDLFFVSYSIGGNTIGNARALARLRDKLPLNKDVRVLRDEASEKFCELLYPHFCRFEKGLREAITVATCAEQGNFDEKRVVELEEKLTLEALYSALFIDSKFVKEAKNLTKSDFTRDQLIEMLGSLDECLLWNVLFSIDDMPTFRDRRIEIKDLRNDVMHYHKMDEATYEDAKALLKAVNNEIDDYLDKVRSDISYPRGKAGNAKMAAQMINESYASMLEDIRSSLNASGLAEAIGNYSDISNIIASSLETSGYTGIMQQITDMAADMSFANLAMQLFKDQSLPAFGLSSSTAKALEAMKANLPHIDVSISNLDNGISGSTKAAIEATQSVLSTSMLDSVKGISAYYNQLIPPGTANALKLATSASLGFSAGLDFASALPDAPNARDGVSNYGSKEEGGEPVDGVQPDADDE